MELWGYMIILNHISTQVNELNRPYISIRSIYVDANVNVLCVCVCVCVCRGRNDVKLEQCTITIFIMYRHIVCMYVFLHLTPTVNCVIVDIKMMYVSDAASAGVDNESCLLHHGAHGA